MQILISNKTKLINTVYVVILFLLGICYGKIRSELFDGADRLYEAIAFKINFFGHSRFSTTLNGIIPWIVANIHDNPKWVLYAFILNYSLTPFVFFLIFRYYFKDEYLVTFYLVGLTLFYTIIFFHPNHDALFGYYYVILLYGYLKKYNLKHKFYFHSIFIISVLFAFSHPSQVPSALILLLYLKVYQKNSFPFLKVMGLFFLALAIKILIFSNSYEAGIYSEMADFSTRIISLFYSPLIKTFFASLYTINLVVSFVFLITAYVLFKSNRKELLFIIIIHIFFNLFFITFFFQDYPYVFATEGYLKGSTFLLSIIFLDYFLFNSTYSIKIRNTVLTSVYLISLIIIVLNGFSYIAYFNNISNIASKLNQNTVYVSPDAQKIEQYFILHRQSALMNLTEQNKCFYFQYLKDTSEGFNSVMERDIKDNKLCFGLKPFFKNPDVEIKRVLDTQFDLIFDLTNLEKRMNYKKYIYNSGEN